MYERMPCIVIVIVIVIGGLIQKIVEYFEKKFIGERDDGHSFVGLACILQLNNYGNGNKSMHISAHLDQLRYPIRLGSEKYLSRHLELRSRALGTRIVVDVCKVSSFELQGDSD